MNDGTYRSGSGGWNPMAILRDVVTAWRLLWDPRVPMTLKMLLPIAAALYWISPLDLLPGLPFDDIAIMLLALRAFVQLAPKEAVRNAARREETNDGPVVDTTWRKVE